MFLWLLVLKPWLVKRAVPFQFLLNSHGAMELSKNFLVHLLGLRRLFLDESGIWRVRRTNRSEELIPERSGDCQCCCQRSFVSAF